MRDAALGEGDPETALLTEPNTAKRLAAEPLREHLAAFPDTQLSQLLGETIWDRLRWSQLPPGKLDRATLIQAYNASLELLDTFKQDVTTFLRSACLANLEFRQGHGLTHEDARARALETELQTMLARAKWKATPSMSVVDAEVASQPSLFLRRQLNTALGQAIDDFTVEFRKLLDRLVQAKLVGRIAWMPNHCCGYDFFKHVLVQENHGPSQSTHVVDAARPTRRDGRDVIGHEVTTEVRGKGRHLLQQEEHEHVVINAVRTSIGNSQVVMPPAVVEMTKHVPEWLNPFVQVVDGDLCRESIDTRIKKVTTWKDATVTRRPIFGWEPAVIIGSYVLTGWGPREVAAELARRDMLAAKHHASSIRARLPWFGAVLLSATVVVLFWQALHGAGGTFFAILALLAALTMLWQGIVDRETARQHPRAVKKASWWTGAVGLWLLALGSLLFMWFHSLAPIVPLGLLLGGLGCVWMGDPESVRGGMRSFKKLGGART